MERGILDGVVMEGLPEEVTLQFVPEGERGSGHMPSGKDCDWGARGRGKTGNWRGGSMTPAKVPLVACGRLSFIPCVVSRGSCEHFGESSGQAYRVDDLLGGVVQAQKQEEKG